MTVADGVLERTGRLGLDVGKATGIASIALGVLAFWVALPPLHVRSAAVPVVLGVGGILAGIWSWRLGHTRLGWTGMMIALLGLLAGVLATRAAVGNLQVVITWGALTAATLRYATPLVFASIGGLFSERSGVVNIGLEGMMLMGAFFGIWGSVEFGHWAIGLLTAMLAGGLLALIHAFFSIHLRAEQIVTGTAINILAIGLTGYLYIRIYGDEGTPSELSTIPDVPLGPIGDIYFVGPILDGLNLMIWLAFATVVLTWVVIYRTPLGLRIRAAGEHPRAAESVGVSVYAIRYAAVTLSGVLAALGGAYLSIGFVGSFTENMTVGRGFIALAALIFGMWKPFGAMGAALLFGFSSALARALPEYSEQAALLFETLPYVLTLVAVVGLTGRSIPPAAVGRPFAKQ
jgi:ABC-type uncharacterized transport system permease subunit